jgi:FlaA1/EpsC-like NDP-sugar epimerase
MTIPEACRLVLEAANMGKGGEIFVFDMGDPVKIVDLAQSMVRLSGYTPGKDVKIVFTGLRPGEKLYEEVLFDDEQMQSTYNKKIRIAHIRPFNHKKVSSELLSLYKYATKMEDARVLKQMKRMVPEFVHK